MSDALGDDFFEILSTLFVESLSNFFLRITLHGPTAGRNSIDPKNGHISPHFGEGT